MTLTSMIQAIDAELVRTGLGKGSLLSLLRMLPDTKANRATLKGYLAALAQKPSKP
jgi:hypothetical protein